MDTYEHIMTEYRAATGMPEDWGLYPKRVSHAVETDPLVMSRTANVVRHPDFGAAILVVDGSGTPLYIPKSKAQLVRLIEDAARLLGELERL